MRALTMLIWQATRIDENKTYDEYHGYICVAPDFQTASITIPEMLRKKGQERVEVGLPVTDKDWEEEKAKWAHVEDHHRPVWTFEVIGEAIGNTTTRVLFTDFANA